MVATTVPRFVARAPPTVGEAEDREESAASLDRCQFWLPNKRRLCANTPLPSSRLTLSSFFSFLFFFLRFLWICYSLLPQVLRKPWSRCRCSPDSLPDRLIPVSPTSIFHFLPSLHFPIRLTPFSSCCSRVAPCRKIMCNPMLRNALSGSKRWLWRANHTTPRESMGARMTIISTQQQRGMQSFNFRLRISKLSLRRSSQFIQPFRWFCWIHM